MIVIHLRSKVLLGREWSRQDQRFGKLAWCVLLLHAQSLFKFFHVCIGPINLLKLTLDRLFFQFAQRQFTFRPLHVLLLGQRLLVILPSEREELRVSLLTSSELIANISHGKGLVALFHRRYIQMAFGDEWISGLGQEGVVVLLVERAGELWCLNYGRMVQVFVEKVLGCDFRHLPFLFLFGDVSAIVVNIDRSRTNVSQILNGLLTWVAIAISHLVLKRFLHFLCSNLIIIWQLIMHVGYLWLFCTWR